MKILPYFALSTLTITSLAHAGGSHRGGVHAGISEGVLAPFDIVHARVSFQGNVATFHMGVSGQAGSNKPTANGKLVGSDVFSYVWPTTLNSSTVGFAENAGILALAVTAHPDFDDTPLYDENADNDPGNDGNVWHSHWVVLKPNEHCGADALAVVDIPEGSKPTLPNTWPGLPLLLDSPGWDPIINEDIVEVKVAFDHRVDLSTVQYDGVTAGLRVNQSAHAPLLCVVNVMDIASGDLSLPGRIEQ
ncbi:hypothetical protein [Microbulbifer sp. THAF38]|uniref:hypothetical protein n=1 Tax=Microbulbifer sp. THAF38 TaxID=2587856 RepID=UPI001268DE02|nr:hypothetical protein [Microbulbifer sp. THAF38]QFT54267.1 hypothetical protein FIU95_06800 [Microbulbifer sp. THAF38]